MGGTALVVALFYLIAPDLNEPKSNWVETITEPSCQNTA